MRPDRARIPDVAWVSQPKLAHIPRANQAISLAPDIAVEVISESEQPEEIEQKLRDYLKAEVEVWQVFPALRRLTVWRGNQGWRLEGEQLLTSERLPGFAVATSALFE